MSSKRSGEKVSANFLLNFRPTVDDRKTSQPNSRPPNSHSTNKKYPNTNTKAQAKKKFIPFKAFTKETYIQANYRFVVSHKTSLTPHLQDPNFVVPWNSIEQVFALFINSKNDEYHCPICLEFPTAPKMTKCGHIFCWPCLIQHLSYSKSSKLSGNCPICGVFMNMTEMVSVSIQQAQLITPSERKVKFTLLKRSRVMSFTFFTFLSKESFDEKGFIFSKKKTSVLIPKLRWNESRSAFPRFDDPHTSFTRIVSCTDIRQILNRESRQLDDLAKEVKHGDETAFAFVQIAQDQLLKRKQEFLENSLSGSDKIKKQLESERELQSEAPVREEDFFYLYQADDTQQVFFHPLCMKALLYEFGSYEKLPVQIEASVLEIENFTQDEETQKRYKFLNHLPLTCEFRFAEIQLKGVVSDKTVEHFQGEINKRAQKREREQKQRELELKNQPKLGNSFRNVHIDHQDTTNFPVYSPVNSIPSSNNNNNTNHNTNLNLNNQNSDKDNKIDDEFLSDEEDEEEEKAPVATAFEKSKPSYASLLTQQTFNSASPSGSYAAITKTASTKVRHKDSSLFIDFDVLDVPKSSNPKKRGKRQEITIIKGTQRQK